MSLSHSPSVITSNLLLYLDPANSRSYPGTGTTWFDISGNSRNATLNLGTGSGVTYSSNNLGTFTVDGFYGYMYVPSATWMPTETQPQSFDCFVRLKSYKTSFFIGRTSPSNEYGNFGIGSTGTLFMYNTTTMNESYQLPSSGILNNWHHYGYTYDGSIIRMYLDGVNVYTSASGKSFKASSNNLVFMGWDVFNRSPGSTFYASIDCDVGTLRWYNKFLTDSEIQRNFNALRGRFNI